MLIIDAIMPIILIAIPAIAIPRLEDFLPRIPRTNPVTEIGIPHIGINQATRLNIPMIREIIATT